MKVEQHQKVQIQHLQRKAYLYIRQSTLRQVMENAESTLRQYDLRQRAVALGWPIEHVVVIDCDLGQSGASSVDRDGFQQLVTEVGMGRAGIVMGWEVSRLARNSSDWHRLLEMCALTDTLILDEDGIYDPSHFNDRLLLGLKGTMSEAELHVLRARLRGGMLNKARRGELAMRLPVGFVYDTCDRVVLNPDQQVQKSIRLLFDTFRRVGSAHATVRDFREQGLLFPKRLHGGPSKGEIVWRPLSDSRVAEVLHNPRYVGAYVYGRRTQKKNAMDGSTRTYFLPRDKWHAMIPNAHVGYIAWQEFERNQQVLEANARAKQANRKCPPREGPALLQGLAVCGVCGARMSVRYHQRRGSLNPDYVCKGLGNTQSLPKCQSIPGDGIDRAIGELLLDAMTPFALEISLAVQQEVQSRIEEADQVRYQQVERTRYEADLARRRYMQVDPGNRLVADELESDWNHKLRALTESQEEYERRRESDRLLVDDETKSRILALAHDVPRLWRDPKTPDRERKRMVRLIIEDVTLIKDTSITVHVRFKGGATRSLSLPRPLSAWEQCRTPAEVVKEIDHLLDQHTPGETAQILNQKGYRSGGKRRFHGRRVGWLVRKYGLKSRYARLRASGLLTLEEVADRLGCSIATMKKKRREGRLPFGCQKLNDEGEFMYEDPLAMKASKSANVSTRTHEVQNDR